MPGLIAVRKSQHREPAPAQMRIAHRVAGRHFAFAVLISVDLDDQ
jgi:hypothetical protein